MKHRPKPTAKRRRISEAPKSTARPGAKLATRPAKAAKRVSAEQARSFRAAIVESTDDVIIGKTLDGTIVSWNRAAERFYGYTAGEMIGRSVTLLQPPDLPDDVSRILECIRKGEKVERYETQRITKGGLRVDILLTVSPVWDEAGRLIGASAIAHDISELKRMEAQLRTSAEQYRLLFERHPQPMYVVERETRIFLAVNEAAVQKYGYSREEFLAMTLDRIRPAEELAKFQKYFAALPGRFNASGVWKHRTKDGRLFDVEITRDEIRYQNKDALLVVANDITERRRAEQALRESERRFRLITETISEVFWISSADNNTMLYVSPAYERIWGRPQASLYQAPQSFLEPIFPEDSEWAAEIINFKRAGEPFNIEYRIQHPDGNVRWIWDRGFPARDETGQLRCYVGVAQDITERKQLESQLRQSQKMEAIGQLAGGIAHDFNNLLTVIAGYGKLVLEGLGEDALTRRQMAAVLTAAERATLLTQQLLAFSRRKAVAQQVLNLNQVITEMEPILARLIGEHIELAAVPGQDLGTVQADPGQIEQILLNLCVNARDAMPQGGKLTIETANVELDDLYVRQHAGVKPGAYVMLAVSDTGMGMDQTTQLRIFEPFFTTKEKGKGTGLGLATIYGIVEQSGGQIWVYSEPGCGTTFKIYLPRLELRLAPEPAARPAQSGLPRGAETVLFVEDDAAIREMCCEALKSLGYEVLCAASGTEALGLAQQHAGQIDLLVTDLVMPGIQGRELAEKVAALQPSLRTLYISGYTDDALARSGGLGANTIFLQKPFTIDALARKLREMVIPSNQPADAAAAPGKRSQG